MTNENECVMIRNKVTYLLCEFKKGNELERIEQNTTRIMFIIRNIPVETRTTIPEIMLMEMKIIGAMEIIMITHTTERKSNRK